MTISPVNTQPGSVGRQRAMPLPCRREDSLVSHAQASCDGPGMAGKHLCNPLAFLSLHTGLVFSELSPLAREVQEPYTLSHVQFWG